MIKWKRRSRFISQNGTSLPVIRSVGIIGAGTMGRAIAAAHALQRVLVVIYDADANTLAAAATSIADELGNMDSHRSAAASGCFLHVTADLAEVAGCDLVLESTVETLPAKLQLFSQLQPHLGEHTIVASNTSTIPIRQLARDCADASRFCGIHFCHPVRDRPLVEIAGCERTSKATIAAVVAHVRRIGRMSIMVEDDPGFVVNRLLFPYLGEALELLREGVSAETIDQAAVEFRMAIGPLRLMDEIGLDTVLQAAWRLAATFPDRIVSSPLLVSMVKAGKLGRKVGAGFFVYREKTDCVVHCDTNGEPSGIIAPWIVASPRDTPNSLKYRLILPMLLEATRLLEEGKVNDARDIDLAMLFGLGFPSEKGGLLWWADTLGARQIISLLRCHDSLESRMKPTMMLYRLAQIGGRVLSAPKTSAYQTASVSHNGVFQSAPQHIYSDASSTGIL
jgi:3-hydroxyacyl-CoA dehydrogenase